MRAAFGPCVFDSETRQVSIDGRPVELAPKAFEFLGLLLEERPRALAKDELHERLWPETFVSDTSLARLASEVRSALGDDARAPRYIRTVHGYGYSFVGEIDVEPDPASEERGETRCWLVWGRRSVALAAGENLIGRSAQARLRIESRQVSRRHSLVVVEDDGARIEDLGSKNGTYCRGRRIDGSVDLQDGDEIAIGPAVLVFRAADRWESTLTAFERPVP